MMAILGRAAQQDSEQDDSESQSTTAEPNRVMPGRRVGNQAARRKAP